MIKNKACFVEVAFFKIIMMPPSDSEKKSIVSTNNKY